MKKQNEVLVIRRKDQAMTTSLVVAEQLGKPHRAVMRDIRNLLKARWLPDDFDVHNFVHISHEDKYGREQPCYEITFEGFLALISGYNGEKARKAQLAISASFVQITKWISDIKTMRSVPEWYRIRSGGKEMRSELTSVFQRMGLYMIEQGSQNPGKVYMLYSKMLNNVLFEFPEGVEKPDDFRDFLSVRQLFFLGAAEAMLEAVLLSGMEQGLPYKEIYQNAKRQVEGYVASIGGKTQVLTPQQSLFGPDQERLALAAPRRTEEPDTGNVSVVINLRR